MREVKPRLLDLFSGAGGATKGYQRAGFHVTGVDINPQPRYCGDEFHQADAMTFPLEGFDAIHASPPCPWYSTMSNRWGSTHPALIGDVRSRLERTGGPWVIENVAGAKRHMRSPIELTGEMFGLGAHRARLFESNVFMLTPPKPARQSDAAAMYGKNDGRRLWTRTDGSELRVASLEEGSDAMGIDWMEWRELCEAIPPDYAQFIGEQLIEFCRPTAADATRPVEGEDVTASQEQEACDVG